MSKRILWLASWYPSQVDPLTGDFVERHAKAASLFNEVTVLFVVRDKYGKSRKEIINYSENCRAWIYYYKAWGSIQYFVLYLKLIKEYINTYGKPGVVHVHVVFRAGLIALYLKCRYGIKYIITEHWSLFHDAATSSFNKKPFYFRYLIRLIYSRAAAATAVSSQLSSSIADKMGIKPPKIVFNVFDSALFYPEENHDTYFQFIHVSTLTPNKNLEAIIQATAILDQLTVVPFKLTVYGPNAKHLNIEAKNVEWRNDVPQNQLAAVMRRQNALILYSRHENQPCVIIEAHACGLPVIVSDISAMKEMVEDRKTGLIVALDNPQLLAEKMLWTISNYETFDKDYIHRQAYDKYNFYAIGKQFDEIYNATI